MENDIQTRLKGPIQLLKESWRIYRLKIKTLSGIIAVIVGFSFLFWIFIFFLNNTPVKYSIWFSIVEAFDVVGYFFLWLWAMPSLIFAIKEDIGIIESYKKGAQILGSYIWVYFLLTVITTGGLLLFIVPGFLFSIWFSLTLFVLIFENRKGFDALFRSKQLIKGDFWRVLWRFLVLGLAAGIGLFLILLFIYFLYASAGRIEESMAEFFSYLLQLFVLPFFLIYGFLIYNNLKDIKSEASYTEPPKIKKAILTLPGILGILIFGLLISISFLNIFLGRDEPPINDSDLWLSRVEIQKEENAYYDIMQAKQKLYLPAEKINLFNEMYEGKSWDPEFAEELIVKNKEVFDYFEKALELSYFQLPEWQDPKTIGIETVIPSIAGLRDMAKLNSIRANHFFLQGREKEALDLIVKTIKMGQMVEDSPRPILITYLTGSAVKERGLYSLRGMMKKTTLPPEVLKDYVAQLDPFKANEEGLIRAIKMEYINLTNTKSKIDAAFAGKLSKGELEKLGINKTYIEIQKTTNLSYFYKPNQTQRMLAEYYRNFVDNVNKSYNETSLLEIEPSVPTSRIKMLFTENIVGKFFHDITGVGFSPLLEKKYLEDFSIIGTQYLIATKAYYAETGKIPANLSELVPEYFSEVLKDPFDGTAIKYSSEKKTIYSVGKDLKDTGGSEGEYLTIMEDPTFKLNF